MKRADVKHRDEGSSYHPYLRWIEEQLPHSLSLLKSWANTNSYTNNLEGLAIQLSLLKEEFSKLGGKQQVLSLPPRIVVDKEGKLSKIPVGQALTIRKRPEAPIQVLLAGHMDTVYPPSSSFQTVIETNTQSWVGPGVTDMKGGLIVLYTALATLERTPFAHQIGWEVIINPDEEVGSVSSESLFLEAAQRHQVGLIFEPAFHDGYFVRSRKGSANYTIVTQGQAAHAGRDFSQGKSAIYALAHFIQELEKFNDPELGLNVNVGFIQGGGPVNIVPDFALCKINIRSCEAAKMQTFQRTLEGIAHSCMTREGIRFGITQETFRLPKPFDQKTEQLFNQIAQVADELQIPFQWRDSGGVCDGNILSHAGLATIDSLGVVGGHLHTHAEYIDLYSLTQRAQLTALYLMKLATKELYV